MVWYLLATTKGAAGPRDTRSIYLTHTIHRGARSKSDSDVLARSRTAV